MCENNSETAVGNRSPVRSLVAGGPPGGVLRPPLGRATSCKKDCCERTNTVHRCFQPCTSTKRSTTCNLPQMCPKGSECSNVAPMSNQRHFDQTMSSSRRSDLVSISRAGTGSNSGMGPPKPVNSMARNSSMALNAGADAPQQKGGAQCWWQRARREHLHKLSGILAL